MRVVTFNIHHGASADDRLDLARTAAQIRALDADVVGLQEVDVAFGDRSAGQDQARMLGEMLGMDVAFAPAIDRPAATPDGPRRRYGVALLVRGRILDAQTHLLPAAAGLGPLREPRAVLCAQVRTASGADGASDTHDAPAADGGRDAEGATEAHLTVLVTHLDTERREHRAAQIARILDLAARSSQDAIGRRAGASADAGAGAGAGAGAEARAEAGVAADAASGASPGAGQGAAAGAAASPSAIPMVLLGDMNADQGAPEMQLLTQAGWRDAALEANGRAPSARTSSPAPRAGLTALLRAPLLGVVRTAVVSAVANVVSAVTPGSFRRRRAGGGGVRGSFPAVFPVRRIDGIWIHGALSARSVAVTRGRASDHRPVLAQLERTGPA